MSNVILPNLGIKLPDIGSNQDTWGNILNDDLNILDTAVQFDVISKTLSNVDVTLTAAEAASAVVNLTGTLTANVNVIVPATPVRVYLVRNQTSGAFTVTVKTAAGTGTAVQQGTSSLVYSDGTNIIQGATSVNGSFAVSGALTAASFSGAGTGLTGTASGLSIGGNAATATSATTATNANNLAVTNDTTTNATYYPTFSVASSGNSAKKVSTNLTYNPGTNTLTAGTFAGALSGNATTATTLQTARTINGVSFNGSANISINLNNSLTAGNGLTGTAFNGGAASTFALGTPSSISNTSTDSVTATSHTHALIGELVETTAGSPAYYGARAFVNFNGTGTVAIRNSQNVSSITDNAVGAYTVNLTTAMPDANYTVNGNAGDLNSSATVVSLFRDQIGNIVAPTVSAFRIITSFDMGAGQLSDNAHICVSVFR